MRTVDHGHRHKPPTQSFLSAPDLHRVPCGQPYRCSELRNGGARIFVTSLMRFEDEALLPMSLSHQDAKKIQDHVRRMLKRLKKVISERRSGARGAILDELIPIGKKRKDRRMDD